MTASLLINVRKIITIRLLVILAIGIPMIGAAFQQFHQEKPGETTAELCEQLDEIRWLPENAEICIDPIYCAIVNKRSAIMPCLIEKITSQNEMPFRIYRDQGFPIYVGDMALILISDIVRDTPSMHNPTNVLDPDYEGPDDPWLFYNEDNLAARQRCRETMKKWFAEWKIKNPKIPVKRR